MARVGWFIVRPVKDRPAPLVTALSSCCEQVCSVRAQVAPPLFHLCSVAIAVGASHQLEQGRGGCSDSAALGLTSELCAPQGR